MDFNEYRQRGKELVDYIADYLENVSEERVYPDVQPGYMRRLLPDHPPQEGEAWEDIFRDFERVIKPGMTHWQSPHWHSYYPALVSFPSLLGDMLADATGSLCFTWASNPAGTELETIVMDWLAKMLALPEIFLNSNNDSSGGGVLQTTSSESTFVCMLAARAEAIRKVQLMCPGSDKNEINGRLVAYCSNQANSSVEKASLIGLIKMRFLQTDDQLVLRGETLQKAIEEDRAEGLIPFFLVATLGTTGTCAFDDIRELGPICTREELWMHIDAAYAGTAFLCPEYRCWLDGVEFASSFAFNPSKWMMTHFDCTALWLRDSGTLHRKFNVNYIYLEHEKTGASTDYMHWQVPLSRRFRALKLFFVIRSFGVKGLQQHVRHSVSLAKKFESLVSSHPYFEVSAPRHLGLVVFRMKCDNDLNEALLQCLNREGKVQMVPASLKGTYVIRFAVTSQHTTTDNIDEDWWLICRTGEDILVSGGVMKVEEKLMPSRKVTIHQEISSNIRRKSFGTSLLLSDSLTSPRVINASFAAINQTDQFAKEFTKQFGGDCLIQCKENVWQAKRKLYGAQRSISLDACMLETNVETLAREEEKEKQQRRASCHANMKVDRQLMPEEKDLSQNKQQQDANFSPDGLKDTTRTKYLIMKKESACSIDTAVICQKCLRKIEKSVGNRSIKSTEIMRSDEMLLSL